MSKKIRLNHHCFNMTLRRWPQLRSIHFWSRDRKDSAIWRLLPAPYCQVYKPNMDVLVVYCLSFILLDTHADRSIVSLKLLSKTTPCSCNRLSFDKQHYTSPLFCKKGDNPQNINFRSEARRWLPFMYNKYLETWGSPPPSCLLLKMELSSLYMS